MALDFFVKNVLSETQKKQILSLANIDDAIFDKMIAWFNEYDKLPQLNSATKFNLCQATGINPSEVHGLIKATSLLMYALSREHEDVDLSEICDEFRCVMGIDINQKRLFDIKSLSTRFAVEFDKISSIDDGSVMLEAASMSAILKPAIRCSFDPNVDKIEDYNPEIVDLIPMVSFVLTTSDERTTSFHMSNDGFEMFLNDVLSLKIELMALKNKYNISD